MGLGLARAARAAPPAMAALATLLVLLPVDSAAVPVLGLLVPGDARQVAAGGTDVFLNFEAEPERLFYPARLGRPGVRRLVSRVDNELTLEIERTRFAGTRLGHRRLSLGGDLPVEAMGQRAGISASFRQESGLTRVDDSRRGLKLQLAEARNVATLAAGGQLGPWLEAGAAVEFVGDAGPGFIAELRAFPHPLITASFREGLRQTRLMIAAPLLSAGGLALPALTYDLHQSRPVHEALLELGAGGYGWLRLAFDFAVPHRAYAELASPEAVVVVRLAAERAAVVAEDFVRVRTVGNLARAHLTLTQDRALAGLDWHSGIGLWRVRYVHGSIETALSLREMGTAGAQAAMDVDAQLDLFAENTYRVRTQQLIVGFERGGRDRFQWSAGMQVLRLSAAGQINYGARQLSRLESEQLPGSKLWLAGATAGIRVRLTRGLSVHASLAQFVPLWMDKPGTRWNIPLLPDPASPDPGAPVTPVVIGIPTELPPVSPAPQAPPWTRLKKALGGNAGGSLQVVELVQEF